MRLAVVDGNNRLYTSVKSFETLKTFDYSQFKIDGKMLIDLKQAKRKGKNCKQYTTKMKSTTSASHFLLFTHPKHCLSTSSCKLIKNGRGAFSHALIIYF